MDNRALTKRRWLVLLSSCLVNLCIGAMYVWSVFAEPMAEKLSLLEGVPRTAADLAIVFSVGNSTGFVTMIGGGFLNRRLGPRWVVFLGGVLFGLGFVVCGFAAGIPMLLLGYGIGSGLAMGIAYGCTISNSVKFFPDKAGLVGGIATASYGISSVLIPPIANLVIERVGVSRAFLYFGVMVICIVGIFSQFILPCPYGFCPEGWAPAEAAGGKKQERSEEYDWKQMLRMPAFYIMLFMLFFGASLGMMVISQASAIAQNLMGMSAASAAIIVSVLALFNTLGRILAGLLSDRIGCIGTLTGVFLLAMLSMLTLYFSTTVLLFSMGVCLAGVCFGAFMGVYPSFTASRFGGRNAGVNYGIMFIGFNAAGLVAPLLAGGIFKATASYRPAFLLGLLFALIGLGFTGLYRLERRHP